MSISATLIVVAAILWVICSIDITQGIPLPESHEQQDESSPNYAWDCNKPNMIRLTKADGKWTCYCDEGFYLLVGNPFDPATTSKCKFWTNCTNLKDRPYQIQAGGKYTDTLCCPSPDMEARKTEFGYYECQQPKTISTTPSANDISCKNGYYIQMGNLLDPSTSRCRVCSDCNILKNTPYEIQACGPYSDTLCCASPGMTSRKTKHGHFECYLPATSSSRPHTPPKGIEKSCSTGYFLQLGNELDPNTARCRPCKECLDTKHTPHTTRTCGQHSDTLCCASPHMQARQTELGYFECFLPPSPTTPPSTNVSCDAGYYRDLRDAKCRPCSDCNNYTLTPHQIRACDNFSNTLCCASADMEARRPTEHGYFVCSLPNTSPPTPTIDSLTECDKPNMKIDEITDGKYVCVCEDGSPATKSSQGFTCPGVDGHPESSSNGWYYGGIIIGIIILSPAAAFMVLLVQIRQWRDRALSRSNEPEVESEALMPAAATEETLL